MPSLSKEIILNIKSISNSKDYLISMHEIGHALTPRIRLARDKYLSLYDKTVDMKFPRNKSKTVKFLKEFKRNYAECLKCSRIINSPHWRITNETIAWRYAFKNSLIWNDKLKMLVLDSIMTYHKLTKISRKRFHEKYIVPIFK